MTESKSNRVYTMGRTAAETERLIEQSQLYEGLTWRFLREAGLTRGMRVLDVGSGAGDVALAIAELVGPEGFVVGVDMNAEILATARARVRAAGLTNVEFAAGDVAAIDLEGDFDAVVGRFVLLYIPNPADVLKQLATRLRRGGIIAFQEPYLTALLTTVHPDTPNMNKLMDWVPAVFEHSGANIDMGLDLYSTFVDAGLPEPTMTCQTPMGAVESWPGYQYIAHTLQSLLPLMEKFGIATAEEVDVATIAERVRREVVASKRPVVLPPHVMAWSQLAS